MFIFRERFPYPYYCSGSPSFPEHIEAPLGASFLWVFTPLLRSAPEDSWEFSAYPPGVDKVKGSSFDGSGLRVSEGVRGLLRLLWVRGVSPLSGLGNSRSMAPESVRGFFVPNFHQLIFVSFSQKGGFNPKSGELNERMSVSTTESDLQVFGGL